MNKEKLTMQRIEQDLKEKRKAAYRLLVGWSIFFACLLAFFCWTVSLDELFYHL